MKTNKLLAVFDNPNVQDRYSIIMANGDVYSASSNPFEVNGIAIANGNIGEDYFRVTIGYNWKKDRTDKQIESMIVEEAKRQVEIAKSCPDWMGKEMSFNDLPLDVRMYVMTQDKFK